LPCCRRRRRQIKKIAVISVNAAKLPITAPAIIPPVGFILLEPDWPTLLMLGSVLLDDEDDEGATVDH
jgi:hypothetical protein